MSTKTVYPHRSFSGEMLVGRWCILRTNGARTLALVQSLSRAGIDAWSPRQIVKKRLPRGRKASVERETPITPSFVFARAEHLNDLVQALQQHLSPHPRFTIFHHAGGIPLVDDRSIQHLREAEERARRAIRKSRYYAVPVGQKVKPTEGAFAGLDGVVEDVGGKQALVCFNGNFRVKIATWLLVPDDVDAAPSRKSIAA